MMNPLFFGATAYPRVSAAFKGGHTRPAVSFSSADDDFFKLYKDKGPIQMAWKVSEGMKPEERDLVMAWQITSFAREAGEMETVEKGMRQIRTLLQTFYVDRPGTLDEEAHQNMKLILQFTERLLNEKKIDEASVMTDVALGLTPVLERFSERLTSHLENFSIPKRTEDLRLPPWEGLSNEHLSQVAAMTPFRLIYSLSKPQQANAFQGMDKLEIQLMTLWNDIHYLVSEGSYWGMKDNFRKLDRLIRDTYLTSRQPKALDGDKVRQLLSKAKSVQEQQFSDYYQAYLYYQRTMHLLPAMRKYLVNTALAAITPTA